MEIKKKNTEEKLKRMQENALSDVKNISIKCIVTVSNTLCGFPLDLHDFLYSFLNANPCVEIMLLLIISGSFRKKLPVFIYS